MQKSSKKKKNFNSSCVRLFLSKLLKKLPEHELRILVRLLKDQFEENYGCIKWLQNVAIKVLTFVFVSFVEMPSFAADLTIPGSKIVQIGQHTVDRVVVSDRSFSKHRRFYSVTVVLENKIEAYNHELHRKYNRNDPSTVWHERPFTFLKILRENKIVEEFGGSLNCCSDDENELEDHEISFLQ